MKSRAVQRSAAHALCTRCTRAQHTCQRCELCRGQRAASPAPRTEPEEVVTIREHCSQLAERCSALRASLIQRRARARGAAHAAARARECLLVGAEAPRSSCTTHLLIHAGWSSVCWPVLFKRPRRAAAKHTRAAVTRPTPPPCGASGRAPASAGSRPCWLRRCAPAQASPAAAACG